MLLTCKKPHDFIKPHPLLKALLLTLYLFKNQTYYYRPCDSSDKGEK